MAYVSDFTFNGMSRIGNDSCSQDINSIQNSQACTYTLQNYFSQWILAWQQYLFLPLCEG